MILIMGSPLREMDKLLKAVNGKKRQAWAWGILVKKDKDFNYGNAMKNGGLWRKFDPNRRFDGRLLGGLGDFSTIGRGAPIGEGVVRPIAEASRKGSSTALVYAALHHRQSCWR